MLSQEPQTEQNCSALVEQLGESAGKQRSSCCSHVPRPGQFHKRLHGVAEELLEFNEPVRLTGNYRMAPIPGLKHGSHAMGQHRLQKWAGIGGGGCDNGATQLRAGGSAERDGRGAKAVCGRKSGRA